MPSREGFSPRRMDDSDRARPSTQDGNIGQILMTVSTPPTYRVTCVPAGWFPRAASVLTNRVRLRESLSALIPLLDPGPRVPELRGRRQRSSSAGLGFPEACAGAVSASTACTRRRHPAPPDLGTDVSAPAGDRQSSALGAWVHTPLSAGWSSWGSPLRGWGCFSDFVALIYQKPRSGV